MDHTRPVEYVYCSQRTVRPAKAVLPQVLSAGQRERGAEVGGGLWRHAKVLGAKELIRRWDFLHFHAFEEGLLVSGHRTLDALDTFGALAGLGCLWRPGLARAACSGWRPHLHRHTRVTVTRSSTPVLTRLGGAGRYRILHAKSSRITYHVFPCVGYAVFQHLQKDAQPRSLALHVEQRPVKHNLQVGLQAPHHAVHALRRAHLRVEVAGTREARRRLQAATLPLRLRPVFGFLHMRVCGRALLLHRLAEQIIL
mmetsp:Transcript_31674/g.80087  ORF Transcript_31674/g.80087 Transcript_31674/m.80087 type:complete len:254 (-) Transcript_31674:426-1187(-)